MPFTILMKFRRFYFICAFAAQWTMKWSSLIRNMDVVAGRVCVRIFVSADKWMGPNESRRHENCSWHLIRHLVSLMQIIWFNLIWCKCFAQQKIKENRQRARASEEKKWNIFPCEWFLFSFSSVSSLSSALSSPSSSVCLDYTRIYICSSSQYLYRHITFWPRNWICFAAPPIPSSASSWNASLAHHHRLFSRHEIVFVFFSLFPSLHLLPSVHVNVTTYKWK